MKALSQRAGSWLAVGALLAAAGPPVHGEEFAVNKPETAARIDFKVDVQPQDPFAQRQQGRSAERVQPGEVIRLVIQGAPRKGFQHLPDDKAVLQRERQRWHDQVRRKRRATAALADYGNAAA